MKSPLPRAVLPVILFVFTLLFSVSVAAELPTPGGAISETLTFMRGLFTGNSDIADANFITFVLYFILILAIFVEGMKHIPFFGQQGEVTSSGKWFAFAASLLSTIGLFAFNKENALERLIAPFGVWGGLVVAAVIAYITFRFLRDMPAFRDSVMISMAIAAAVAMTFAGLLLNLETVLGWGFLIMIIVFLVGAITAFTSKRMDSGPQRQTEREARTAREVDRFRREAETREERRAREGRENQTRVVRSSIVNALNTIDTLQQALRGRQRPQAAHQAENAQRQLERHLRAALRALRTMTRRERRELRQMLNAISTSAGTALTRIQGIQIPDPNAAQWNDEVTRIIDNTLNGADGVRATCGLMLERLEDYVEGTPGDNAPAHNAGRT